MLRLMTIEEVKEMEWVIGILVVAFVGWVIWTM